jgi:diaminohydroxyphosphoribosylaminopyrimidine deaminase/5-amino-6-(5-phosphoribosylamino)uracil reductase
MVGIHTVLTDNPSLTTRRDKQNNNSDPVRIVVDSKARITIDSKILNLTSSEKWYDIYVKEYTI